MRLGTLLGLVRGGGGGSPPPFDPATLSSLTGWYRAPFSGSPWTPTASLGSSGSNGNLITAGSAPTAGSPVNSLTPASFNGSTQALTNASGSASSFVSTTGLTVICLFMASASVAALANYYQDPTLFTDGGGPGGNFGLTFTSSGLGGGVYIGGSKQVSPIACATGGLHLGALRWDGSIVKVRCDTTDATPVAASGSISLASPIFVGKNYDSTKFFQGDLFEIMTAQGAISDSDLDNITSYFDAQYALSL